MLGLVAGRGHGWGWTGRGGGEEGGGLVVHRGLVVGSGRACSCEPRPLHPQGRLAELGACGCGAVRPCQWLVPWA